MKKLVYLAGKITGDPDYRLKFANAEDRLRNAGYEVINPTDAISPKWGLTHAACMRICAALLDACDFVVLLPDWVDSEGAMYEYGRATAKDKHAWYLEDAVENAETFQTVPFKNENRVASIAAAEMEGCAP